MSATYKLVVGDRVEFDVKFTLNDGGEDKPFGMRLSAKRQPLGEQERELGEQVKVQEFLAARGVALQSWIGKPPLQDAEGAPVPPGPEALDALYRLVGGMVSLVFAGYLRANGAAGASGN
jgi:hypothetical protein